LARISRCWLCSLTCLSSSWTDLRVSNWSVKKTQWEG
jgi:hypothetical protein